MAQEQRLEREVRSTTIDATCPECEYAFAIEDPEPGEIVVCADCSLNLKVTSFDSATGSLTLELTATSSEDWGQ